MKLPFLPRTCALGLGLLLAGAVAQAQDSDRSDWLRNPAMGNYKAYAEFKMAHYAAAREVWETLASVGNGDALFNLAILAEDGLGEPRDMARAEQLYGHSPAGQQRLQDWQRLLQSQVDQAERQQLEAGRRQKLSATPDLSGTVLPLCLIPNSALKSAPPFKSVVPKASACAGLPA